MGVDVRLTCDPVAALSADGLVVPGVGAFAACMDQLETVDGPRIIRERIRLNKPILGICVGHQVMFSVGVEHGIHRDGVGIFPGVIRRLESNRLPHMGWNEVSADEKSRFFEGVHRFYFVHSYGALVAQDLPSEAVGMWTEHDGNRFIAAVECGPILSTQFHPEKSGAAGMALLRRWVDALEVR